MINGVMHIVAAVLFAVIALGNEVDTIWLGIAAAYLLTGIVNLIVYAVKRGRKHKASQTDKVKEGA